VQLLLDNKAVEMRASSCGWHAATVNGARPGLRYRFRIDGELDVPDPASHFQPEDVNGPSELIPLEYNWRCPEWKGRPWHETVLLELHVGTFTPAGNYAGVIDKLDHVVDTGITALELMPLADFAGRRNWGYDGVLPFAPDSAYGRPEELKALIDAAHARGLMVFLDVVYNHFGPEGNYLPRYAPQFFTSLHNTPWGDAIDYRVPQVRAFAIENALHWLRNYRFDGLRLDAVHAIKEPGEPTILEDMSRAVGEFASASGRQIHLVLENDDNRASLLDPHSATSEGNYRAQWNDDYHHAWHVFMTGEEGGYYSDYRGKVVARLARALGSGFIYQGESSEHRGGEVRGEPSGHLPPTAFVEFLQNHDQIGNRAYGDRLSALASDKAVEAALAITLLSPSIPLLFMGEEWGTKKPFPFFCDFQGDLAEAVRVGRRKEFEAQFSEEGTAATPPPDPLSEETFRSAVLDWRECESGAGARRLKLVRSLLQIRRAHVIPLLGSGLAPQTDARVQGHLMSAQWRFADGAALSLVANIGDASAQSPKDALQGTPIWGGDMPPQLPPWSVYCSLGRA
jgi:malto-oligosyltrehalose trehalohydrolase